MYRDVEIRSLQLEECRTYQLQSAVIDLQNQTPTPGICARPGSLDQTPTSIAILVLDVGVNNLQIVLFLQKET